MNSGERHGPAPQAGDGRGGGRAARKVWTREPYEHDLEKYGSVPDAAGSAASLRPLFIVGHPRSGTNWVANLLNLHPQVAVWGELHFHVLLNAMPELVSEPHTSGHTEPVRGALARGFQAFLRSTLASVAQHRGPGAGQVRWVGDHTPRLLRIMLPEAHYIVVQRDGRDVMVSLTVHLLNCQSRRAAQASPEIAQMFERALGMCTPDDSSLERAADWLLAQEAWVKRCAGNWARHVLTDSATMRRLESAGAGGPRVMAVRYEDLHADTPRGLGGMLGFIGADAALAQPLGSDPRTRAGYSDQTPGSHYRKGQVGDWRTRLTPAARGWFASAAQAALEALGYERDASWTKERGR